MAVDAETAAALVAWICWYARERSTSLTTVQLVKYLYLADLWHARRHGGSTLTSWQWAFVHFGPYCGQAMEAVDFSVARGLVIADRYESRYDDKDYRVYRSATAMEPMLGEEVPWAVLSALKGEIRDWAEDTGGLLDYVYFDTEPMQGIEPSEILDFSRSRLPESVVTLPALSLSTRKIRHGREVIARLRERTVAGPAVTPLDTGPHDNAYVSALSTDEDVDAGDGGESEVRVNIRESSPGEPD